ncbi:MAG: hypothetical protein O2904_03015 [bacterium]|nr:hypothetical protein [bacterium]
MAKAKPDMRIFKSLDADHTLFDACLVRQFQDESNWTHSTLEGNIPITLDHFRAHARDQLVTACKSIPTIAGQDYGDRRLLMDHLAQRLVSLSGRFLHTWQAPQDEMIMRFRNALQMVINERGMILEDDDDPLREHFKTKQRDVMKGDKSTSLPFISSSGQDDAKVAKALLGSANKPDHTSDILNAYSPMFMEVDYTYVSSPFHTLRRELFDTVSRLGFISDFTQLSLRKEIMADWNAIHNTKEGINEINAIETEIAEQTGTEDILNEFPADVLRICFTEPLAAETLDEQARANLLRRKPILEFLIHQATEQDDTELFQKLAQTFKEYHTKLELGMRELGHLGLILATADNNRDAYLTSIV